MRKIRIYAISILVDMEPANGEPVLLKSTEGFSTSGPATALEGLITATVMKANTADSDGDIYTPEEIKYAAHNFVKYQDMTIDLNHNFKPLRGVFIVESKIAENGDWIVVIDISENNELMLSADKISGVSIVGREEETLIEKAKQIIKSLIKAKGKEMNPEEKKALADTQAAVTALTDTVKALVEQVKLIAEGTKEGTMTKSAGTKEETKEKSSLEEMRALLVEAGIIKSKEKEGGQDSTGKDAKKDDKTAETELEKLKKDVDIIKKQRSTSEGGTADSFEDLLTNKPDVLEKMKKENPTQYQKLRSEFLNGGTK